MLNFCSRFQPEIAHKLISLTAILGGKHKPNKQSITFTPEASQAVKISKEILADAVNLAQLRPHPPLQLKPDASNSAVGTGLHQVVYAVTQHIGFFTMNLSQLNLVTTRLVENS